MITENNMPTETLNALNWFLDQTKIKMVLDDCDNQKLAWLLLQCQFNKTPIGSVEEGILSEVIKRLYPEWDEEDVTYQSWGWETPDGDVRYLNEDD